MTHRPPPEADYSLLFTQHPVSLNSVDKSVTWTTVKACCASPGHFDVSWQQPTAWPSPVKVLILKWPGDSTLKSCTHALTAYCMYACMDGLLVEGIARTPFNSQKMAQTARACWERDCPDSPDSPERAIIRLLTLATCLLCRLCSASTGLIQTTLYG